MKNLRELLQQMPVDGTLETLEELQEAYMQQKKRIQVLDMHPSVLTLGPDGRWRTYVRMPDGKRKEVRKQTKKALIDYLVDFYDDYSFHKTVVQIFEEWISEKEEYREVKKSSLARYRTDFRRFFPPEDEFCKMEIQDITEADIERFLKRQIVKQKLTHKTYGGLRILIAGIFRYAKRETWTTISISSFLGDLMLPDSIFTRMPTKADAEEVFTEVEERMLLSWLREAPSLQKLGVILLFQTGLRVGELAALKRSDINIEDMTLSICRTESVYDDEDGRRVIGISEEAKTEAGGRTVYLPETAKRTLQQIQLLNPCGEWLFAYKDGRRMHGKAFRDCLMRACRAVGIPERSTHKIRKTYASAMIDGGANEKFIQKQLGHKDFTTTRRYYNRDRMTEAQKKAELNKIINM